MEAVKDIEEFRHIIEYEINRLDNIINSLYSQIIPVKFYLYASILSVLIFLSQFINDVNNETKETNLYIILLLTITAIAFSFIVFLPILSALISKFLNMFKDKNLLIPLINNTSYAEVLKENIRDQELYRTKIIIPNMILLFVLHIFFGILILSPYYLDNITIIKWDKAFYWVAYFVITDILIFIGLFMGINILHDILFNFKKLLSNLKCADFSKTSRKQKTGIFMVIFFIFIWLILYPFFWYYLTFDFLIMNVNSFINMANSNLFLFILVLFITLIAITSCTNLIGKNYKVGVLTLKQEKYREIRRQLYKSDEIDIHSLWKDFVLNAPW